MKKRLLIIGLILIPLILALWWFTAVEKLNMHYPDMIIIYKDSQVRNCSGNPKQYEPLVIRDKEQIEAVIDNLNKVRYVESFSTYTSCKYDYIVEMRDEDGSTINILITKYNEKYYLFPSHHSVIMGEFDFLNELNFEEKSE